MSRRQRLALWLTSRQAIPAWLALAAIVGGIYLAVADLGYGHNGFPLDDAWIHQTYARNLGQRGQFAFVPGATSTGSTAPLWTLLLSLGYWLGLPFKLWTHGLGILCLGLSGWTLARLSRRLWPENAWLVPGVSGVFLVVEWHQGWAAVSGMETIFFVWLSLLLLERYIAWRLRLQTSLQLGFTIGIVGGLLALTRPEGLGLTGLIGLDVARRWWVSSERRKSQLLAGWAPIGLGLILTISPYFIFNLATTGLLFPNTFYAKQQEYAILLSHYSWLQRWLAVSGVTLVGAQTLLLPGFIWAAVLTVRQRRSDLGLVWVWWFSYLLLYTWRLPVTYQHGRYQIPSLPWLILLGTWGTASLLRLQARRFVPRLLSRVWALTIGVLALAFVAVGAQAYARDVRIIDTEMVQVALWLRDNTAEDALIAAHDIGAIGYFTQRPLLDLAGLITPEVIPFIRDESRLLDYARRQRAQYLVTFPSWYRTIVAAPGLTQVYTTGAPWALEAGGDNMAVYRLEAD